MIPASFPADDVGVAHEIAHWASLPADGPEGRPLPLAGSWNIGRLAFQERHWHNKENPRREWGPNYFVEMIKNGHHVLPSFVDPQFLGKHYIGDKPDERRQKRIDTMMEHYYRKPLEFCREHNLPIAFRDWNWIARIKKYEQWRERWADAKFSVEETSALIENGKPGRLVSPFGPIERWTEWGEFWFGNPIMKRIQEIYPDPPMVVFLDNNEVKVHWARQLTDDHTRFVAKYGKGLSEMEKAVAIREGYKKRLQAMFKAARDSLTEPAWKKNTYMVGYNNLWGTGYIGKGNRPEPGIGFDPEKGWLEWRHYDGGMPEFYDNDWQPGKTDHTPWSPQTEAMNYYSAQARIFERDPDFYWSSIAWDGGRVHGTWRGERRLVGKPYRYATAGQKYDFNRYRGMIQFGLWAMRPRSFREFRGGAHRNAYLNAIWMALVRSVDRPWDNPVLREFWRFGRLVPNRAEKHWFTLEKDDPQWVRDLDRWYLLTCDANPPRDEWTGRTHLRVFSLALALGEKPERRWLIYAHAPLGAVAGASVKLPGLGQINLDHVAVSGSFYLIEEENGELETLIQGGPPEIAVRASKRFVNPGQAVEFDAEVTCPAEEPFTHFTWQFGKKEEIRAEKLGHRNETFQKPGENIVTVSGHLKDGGKVVGQTVVFVDKTPNKTVVYDLSLDEPFAWQGPWDAVTAKSDELLNYRHLPSAGRLPSPVLVGAEFVDDPERGSVLEFARDRDAIWLAPRRQTVLHPQGHPNKTIGFWFKAETVEKRQILYAEGHGAYGFNIYLDRGKLYAGNWAAKERDWAGHWLMTPSLEGGKWYQVAFSLKDASTEVQDEKLYLYLDGELVDTGPGVRVPRHFAVPRIGGAKMRGRWMTRFHDGEKKAASFRGRMDQFLLKNSAE